jgi:hypothetical protein
MLPHDVQLAQIGELKPAFELLGPYPILQFFAALIVLSVVGFGGLAWLKGEKIAKAEKAQSLDSPRSPEAAFQLFFDGPLKAIFDVLHEIQTAQATAKLEYKDQLIQALALNKASFYDTVIQLQAELEGDFEANSRDKVGRLEGIAKDLREIRDMLVRIELRMTLSPGNRLPK